MILSVAAVTLPSQLPYPHHSVYCIVIIIYFMEFQYLIFYACLRLLFLDVETDPGSRGPVPTVCRLFCSNVRGLAGNLSDLTLASCRYDILLCSGTLVQTCVTYQSFWFPDFIGLSCCAEAGCLAPEEWR